MTALISLHIYTIRSLWVFTVYVQLLYTLSFLLRNTDGFYHPFKQILPRLHLLENLKTRFLAISLKLTSDCHYLLSKKIIQLYCEVYFLNEIRLHLLENLKTRFLAISLKLTSDCHYLLSKKIIQLYCEVYFLNEIKHASPPPPHTHTHTHR